MSRFTKNNLRNIRQTFEEKTGVNLNVESRVSPKKTKYLLLAAALCALLLASCAGRCFRGLTGTTCLWAEPIWGTGSFP